MSDRVFELRTYTTNPGKLDALQQRFRDHTLGLFDKHGMEVIAFFTPTDDDAADRTLVYLMAFDSRNVADEAWEAFRSDPDWIKAKADSEVDGVLTERVESVFLTPTDYSPIG